MTMLLPDTYRQRFLQFYKTVRFKVITPPVKSWWSFERAYSSTDIGCDVRQRTLFGDLFWRHYQVAKVDNGYPEVSFFIVVAESGTRAYPEPQYVWQSTSGGDDFEAKFGADCIGTVKAAFYAMLFVVPIAVLGRFILRILWRRKCAASLGFQPLNWWKLCRRWSSVS